MRKPELDIKSRYGNVLQKGLLIALAFSLFVFMTSIERVKNPYKKEITQSVVTIDLPPELRQITKPPPPPRPTVPVETESEDIPDDVTIETTDLNVYSAPAKPEPPPAFVAYDTAPELIHKVVPEYPELARQAGVVGTVWMNLWVDVDGNVVQAKYMRGPEIFKASATTAAMQMKFTPALQRDKPVAVWVSLPFKFFLADQ
jgi:protein TonB